MSSAFLPPPPKLVTPQALRRRTYDAASRLRPGEKERRFKVERNAGSFIHPEFDHDEEAVGLIVGEES